MTQFGITHRTLGSLDVAIIAAYFVVVFAIGFYFSRKERTSTDYFLAGRNIGWFAIGASLFVVPNGRGDQSHAPAQHGSGLHTNLPATVRRTDFSHPPSAGSTQAGRCRVVGDVEGLRQAEPSVRHRRELGRLGNAH